MEINNLHGANIYSNTPGSTPQVDNTQVREQNLETSRSETESQDRSTQAFEVNITQEARDQLAAQNTETTRPEQPEQTDNSDSSPTGPAPEASQIVNIVA